MGNYHKLRRLLSAAVAVALFGCDAPRHNPLDVNNPDYVYAALQGQILSLSLPRQGLLQTSILWKNSQVYRQSDADGLFSFEALQRIDGWLHFQKAGYHNDSLFIKWEISPVHSLDVMLNSISRLDSLIFYSSILNRYPDVQVLELTARMKISDPDHDMDSVFLKCPELQYSDHLSFDTVEDFFEQEHIPMSRLGVSSAEMIIGKEFVIEIRDKYRHKNVIERPFIKRIIRDEASLLLPASHDTVSARPTLRWEPVTPGYPHEYTVEVRTDEVDPQLVWQRERLPKGSYSVTVDTDLPVIPIDSYIWTVWIIDEFGNRARSKYKSFVVKE
jgi:hypothetical protein